jgi:hypothetical protein
MFRASKTARLCEVLRNRLLRGAILVESPGDTPMLAGHFISSHDTQAHMMLQQIRNEWNWFGGFRLQLEIITRSRA